MADVTVVKTGQGPRGRAGTIGVGSTSTLSPGEDATVTNSGTSTEAVLDFGIPQGDPLTFRGAWDNTATYAQSEAVTHSDKLWAANADTDAGDEPGVSGKWTEVPVTTAPFEDVTDHGATGDGSTDDASAIQDAVDNASGKTVWFPDGTYYLGSVVNLASDTHLRFAPGAVVDSSDIAQAFEAAGSRDSANQQSLTSDASRGDTTVDVSDGSVFAAGDYVLLASEFLWRDKAGLETSPNGEIHLVDSVSSNTVTLVDQAWDDYLTTNSAFLAPLNLVTNVSVSGGKFVGSDGAIDNSCLQFQYVDQLDVRDVDLEKYNYQGIGIGNCLSASVLASSIWMTRSAALGYGIGVAGASQWVSIVGNSFRGGRHPVAGGGGSDYGVARFVTVFGNNAYGPSAAFDNHPDCQFWRFIGNSIANRSGNGIYIQSPDTVIADNQIWVAGGQTIRATLDAKVGGALTITGNLTHGGDIQVKPDPASGDVENVVIANNTVHAVDQFAGIRIECDNDDALVRNATISGNAVYDANYSIMLRTAVSASALLTVVSVNGNSLYGVSANQGVRIDQDSGELSYVMVSGNTMTGHGTSISNWGDNATNVYIDGNICGADIDAPSAQIGSNLTGADA